MAIFGVQITASIRLNHRDQLYLCRHPLVKNFVVRRHEDVLILVGETDRFRGVQQLEQCAPHVGDQFVVTVDIISGFLTTLYFWHSSMSEIVDSGSAFIWAAMRLDST